MTLRVSSPVVERAVFYVFLAVLVWAPLPLGSNRVWAVGLLAALLGGLLAVVAMLGMARQLLPRPALARAAPALAAFVGLMALLWFQLIPAAGGPVSVDTHHTRLHLLTTAVYGAAFLLVLLLATHGRRLRLLALALVLSGVFQALLAIFLHAARAKITLGYFEVDHALRAFGSFSYHNSLANYLIMALALGIGLLLNDMEGHVVAKRGWLQRSADALRFFLSPAMRLRLMLVIMVIALVLTRSRMGNVVLLLAIVAVGFPLLWQAGQLSRKGLWLLLSILVVDVAVVGQWVGFERVAQRLSETALVRVDAAGEESIEDRSGPAAHALAMLRERPLLGFGGGSFHVAYPRFNGPELRQYYDHAHNDYVQIASEVGLIGAALLALPVLTALWRAARVRRLPHSSLDGGLALGLLLGIPALLVQATVDFHFQIPANALTFVVLLALAFALRRAGEVGSYGRSHSILTNHARCST